MRTLALRLYPLLLLALGSTVASAQCTPPTQPGTVNFCSPAPNTTVPSPVTISIAATAPSGKSVSVMKLYIDGVLTYSSNGAQMATSLAVPTGTHKLGINFWTGPGTTAVVNTTSFTVGGSGAGVAVNVTPDAQTLAPGATQQFSAAVSGTANASVQWWVDGVRNGNTAVGTISSSGLYTAPSSAGSHRVTAVSNVDGSKRDSSLITVSGVSTPSVNVSPSTIQMQVNTQQQFQASVQNAGNTTVDWFVDDVFGGSTDAGSITTTGLYTAPAAAGTHKVAAKLSTDSSIFGSAQAVVTTSVPTSLQGVFTYAYSNSRTGANTRETILTPQNVSNTSLLKKGTWTLDATIQAQPLYVSGITIAASKHNVLYVATENDSVYALDADIPGKVLWKRSFLTSTSTIGKGFTGGRTALGSSVGITGTPVIDPATNRLYAVTRNTEGPDQVWRMHSISLFDGTDAVPAQIITGTSFGTGMGNDGTGHVPFDSLTQNQRPGLVLSHGVVYVAFASFSDHDPYHGWVFALDAATLKILASFNDSVNGGGGGIWMSGAAIAADSAGNIYFNTGNGRPDADPLFEPPGDNPNEMMKLKLNGNTFAVLDYFAPYNTQCLTHHDLDLASTGVTLIPDKIMGKDVLVTASKEGRAYLIDASTLGKFQPNDDSQIMDSQLFNGKGACESKGFDGSSPYRVYGSPAYWNGSTYFGSVFGPLRQYNINNGKLQQTALSTNIFAGSGQSGRGPMVIVSANGTSNGIVWTVDDDLNGKGWLRAYDATNVSKQLAAINFGAGTHFIEPLVINGSVFVSGHAVLYKYGVK